MEEYLTFPYLRETLLFLALAGVLIPLLQRLRINQVLGFLAAGAMLGPFGVGLFASRHPWLADFTFTQVEGVRTFAETGILFLMFMIGLELSTTRLWALRRWVFGAGMAQVVVSAGVIGFIACLFGNAVSTAMILGLCLSLSSTAVVMQLMSERHALGSPLGQAGFSVLMLQDLAVVPLFILLGLLSREESGSVMPLLGMTILKSVLAVAGIYLLGRRVIRPLFAMLCRKSEPGIFMALTLLSVLGVGAVTAAAGLSMTLGAFLAGLLLAETEFRHEVEVTIEPFRGLLMGLFFLSVGMQTDLREIAHFPLLIPLSVLGLFAVKAAVTSTIFRAGGFGWGRSIEAGLLLGQGGEFALVIVTNALATGLMTHSVAQFMMLVVALSMFVTPLAARGGQWAGERWESRFSHERTHRETCTVSEAQVVIAGFGRVGQLLAQLLAEHGVSYVAIENDAHLANRLHSRGFPVYYGNASRAGMLHRLNAGRASAIVLTMDHPASALHAVKAIRREYPDTPLLARSRDEAHAKALSEAGATAVIPETLESGLQLASMALRSLGIEELAALRSVQAEREKRLQ